MLVAGRVSVLRAVLYIIFQCLGAIAGTAAVRVGEKTLNKPQTPLYFLYVYHFRHYSMRPITTVWVIPIWLPISLNYKDLVLSSF